MAKIGAAEARHCPRLVRRVMDLERGRGVRPDNRAAARRSHMTSDADERVAVDTAMLLAAMLLGPGAGGDADIWVSVEQVHEPIAPGPRLRDYQKEYKFRRHRVGGGDLCENQTVS